MTEAIAIAGFYAARPTLEIEGRADHRSQLTVQSEWLEDGRLASAVFERIRGGL